MPTTGACVEHRGRANNFREKRTKRVSANTSAKNVENVIPSGVKMDSYTRGTYL